MRDEIVRIAARGDGMTVTGQAVPLSAPGDWLDAEGQLHEGPNRQTPPCRHFPRCGGCQLQHVTDGAYRAWLADRIAGGLAAQGVTPGFIRPPHLSPPRSRRRAMLKAQRIGRDILLGFNEGRSHRIVDMRQCEILAPELFALIAPLRRLLGVLLGRKGLANVTLTLADQGADCLISGVDALGMEAHDALLDFAAAGGGSVARIAVDAGDGPEDRWAPDPVTITLGGVPVPLPHAAFLQATREGEASLVAAVLEASDGATSAIDLFSGLGTFSLALSRRMKVTAAEAARDAILSQQRAANLHHRPVTALHRDLFRKPVTAEELRAYSVAVLDPPRAGAEEQARALAASDVPVIAYVSCNPASFARDAAILAAGGYRIDWVLPVGQFRWSTHMELAARFSRG